MVKNKLSSGQFNPVHVTLVRKTPSKHHQIKLASWDNSINHSRVYPENIFHSSTWLTDSSDVIKSMITNKSTTFPSANSLFQQDKNTSQNKELNFSSVINQSKICGSFDKNIASSDNKSTNWKYKEDINQSERITVTWKSTLKFLSISFLGLFVATALILPNVLLYLMLPVIFQTPVNQTTNATEPVTYASHCGNVLPYTNWVYYTGATLGIYMVVDTRNCSFNITPAYYTSIVGNTLRTDFIGYNAIYSATRQVFTVYVRSYEGWTSGQLLNYSQTEKWNLTWIGVIS